MTDTRMTRRGLIGAAGAALTLPLIPARARATIRVTS